MRSLFLTIILISTAATVLILYYSVRQYVANRKYRQKISLIRKKLYEDDRSFLQSRMRRLIPDLKSGHLRWMIVSSKTVKEHKLEITYSSINDDIEIKDRARNRNKYEIKMLNKSINQMPRSSAALRGKCGGGTGYFRCYAVKDGIFKQHE